MYLSDAHKLDFALDEGDDTSGEQSKLIRDLLTIGPAHVLEEEQSTLGTYEESHFDTAGSSWSAGAARNRRKPR